MLGEGFLDTAVNLYFKPEVLKRDIAGLGDSGYHVMRGDASGWFRVADMHRDVAQMFGFPAHYGRNWAALDDCLSDVFDEPVDSRWAGAVGVVMVLIGFDAFVVRCPDAAHALLDIYASQQRTALLGGNQLICLVQSDDPWLQLAPVGATHPQWNRAEWLNKNRQ
jgi:Barstar (barnase inhibitor)